MVPFKRSSQVPVAAFLLLLTPLLSTCCQVTWREVPPARISRREFEEKCHIVFPTSARFVRIAKDINTFSNRRYATVVVTKAQARKLLSLPPLSKGEWILVDPYKSGQKYRARRAVISLGGTQTLEASYSDSSGPNTTFRFVVFSV